MIYFALGTVLAGLAGGFAYLTQFGYTSYVAARTRSFEHPYTHDTPDGVWWRRFGIAFHWPAVLAILASYIILILGAVRIYRSLH